MFEPMTRERLETIFETFKRDALIAGIAPPDWDKTIERVRDMAIEALRQADKAMTPEQLEARNKNPANREARGETTKSPHHFWQGLSGEFMIWGITALAGRCKPQV